MASLGEDDILQEDVVQQFLTQVSGFCLHQKESHNLFISEMTQESRIIKVQRKAAAGSTAQTKSVERGSVLGKIDTGEEKQTCKPCFAMFDVVLNSEKAPTITFSFHSLRIY